MAQPPSPTETNVPVQGLQVIYQIQIQSLYELRRNSGLQMPAASSNKQKALHSVDTQAASFRHK